MVLGQDRRKLSKREDALSLAELRAEGYPPAALVNYLSLLGWSSPDGEEVLDIGELVDRVDLDRVGASNTVIDPEKLKWIAGRHVARMPLDEVVTKAAPFVDPARAPLTGDDLTEAIDIVRTRISVFGEINEHLSFFHPEPGPELDRARASVRDGSGGGCRAASSGYGARSRRDLGASWPFRRGTRSRKKRWCSWYGPIFIRFGKQSRGRRADPISAG